VRAGGDCQSLTRALSLTDIEYLSYKLQYVCTYVQGFNKLARKRPTQPPDKHWYEEHCLREQFTMLVLNSHDTFKMEGGGQKYEGSLES
jgi:hypothetical protein